MAKIKFGRSSRTNSTKDAPRGEGIQDTRPMQLRNNDNDETNNVEQKISIDATIKVRNNHRQQQFNESPAISDKPKSNKRRNFSALRLFYHASSLASRSTPVSSTTKDAGTSNHSRNELSASEASNFLHIDQQSQPPSSASVTPIPGVSSTQPTSSKLSSKRVKSSKIKTDNGSTKQDTSKHSSRLFSSRLSHSNANPASNKSNASMTATNSTIKQVVSIPLPPYEIELTDVDGTPHIECPLCVLLVNYNSTPNLHTCGHRTCLECMQRYLKTEINHSRLKITCPICSEPLQQQVIREILNDDKFYFKYESFMLRKVLAAEPDARWCPAPDCGFAVLATGCASCPRLVCGRDGCKTEFCYHCKQEWHPNQTCSAASIQRNKRGLVLTAFNSSDLISSADEPNELETGNDDGISNYESDDKGDSNTPNAKIKHGRKSSRASQQTGPSGSANTSSLRPEDIKECPVCSSRIIKMNDGSCNHMTCSICETDFCWLCMKEINDLHYFSPSGCTFWGKKPWSRKKKLLWRLGMLVGAPICIVFIAGIAVPAIVIGIPVWAARKLHTRLEQKQFSRYRKNAIITGGVLLSFIVSPIISAMALAVGIPFLLGYVYGVVPLSLCRSSGGCLSSNPSVEDITGAQYQQMTSSASIINQTRNQTQRLQIQAAQQEYKRQQMKSEQKSTPHNSSDSKSTTASVQATPPPYSDVVSVDTATNSRLDANSTTQQGGSSIGEPSMYMSNISLETNSIGNVTNIIERCSRNSTSGTIGGCGASATCCDDRESASNVALSGSILSQKADDAHSTRALAGSIISKESSGYTLVPAEIHLSSSSRTANGDNNQSTEHKTRRLSSVSVSGSQNRRGNSGEVSMTSTRCSPARKIEQLEMIGSTN